MIDSNVRHFSPLKLMARRGACGLRFLLAVGILTALFLAYVQLFWHSTASTRFRAETHFERIRKRNSVIPVARGTYNGSHAPATARAAPPQKDLIGHESHLFIDHRGGHAIRSEGDGHQLRFAETTHVLRTNSTERFWESIPEAESYGDAHRLTAGLFLLHAERGGLWHRRREAFASPITSTGGNAMFEEVVSGTIPLDGEVRTNAVVWGDSKPSPFARNNGARRHFRAVSRHFTPEELLAVHHDMDVVISFVNGSDLIHRFRKFVLNNIPQDLQQHPRGGWIPTQNELGKLYRLNNYSSLVSYLQTMRRLTGVMDREHDELRYSVRSLFAHLRWHCGRILLVSPASIPQWLNRPRNFFMSSRPVYKGRARGERCVNSDARRITVIHQDAIIPMGDRYTFDTNTVELYIHRIRRLSNLYIHFNDDYLTRKNTNVTTFVNEKGGPILLFEDGRTSRARYAAATAMRGNGWLSAVMHTNGFVEEVLGNNVVEDDTFVVHSRRRILSADGHQSFADEKADLSQIMLHPRRQMRLDAVEGLGEFDQPFAFSDLRNPPEALWPRPRYYLKHAPFVYCRNMFRRHLMRYYGDRFSNAGADSSSRNINDYIPPQMHHAFATDVPWAASPHFTPDFMTSSMRSAIDSDMLRLWKAEQLQRHSHSESGDDGDDAPSLTIHLDNSDGCAPALLKIGSFAAASLVTFTDDAKKNAFMIKSVRDKDPTFLTLNDNGYTSRDVENQVMQLLSMHFPFPCMAEHPQNAPTGTQKSLGSRNFGPRDPAVPVIKNYTTASPNATEPDVLSDWNVTMPPDADVRWGDVFKNFDATRGEELQEDLLLEDVINTAPEDQKPGPVLKAFVPAMQRYYERRYAAFNRLPLLLVVDSVNPRTADCAILRSLQLALPDFQGRVGILVVNSVATSQDQSSYFKRCVIGCKELSPHRVKYIASTMDMAAAVEMLADPKYRFAPFAGASALLIRVACLSVLGQSLALEDFAPKRISGMKFLFLEAPCPVVRADVHAKDLDPTGVNWIIAPSAVGLLHSFPIPHRQFEENDDLVYVI